MPRFAANLSWLFTELPFMGRFRAAKAAGFDAVEVLFPYDCAAQEMRDQLVWNDLTFVLMNCPPPNPTGGPEGYAAVPGREDRFRRDFDRALRFAGVLKPRVMHVMAGPAQGPEAKATFIDNLRWAAARAPKQQLTIEPINPVDMPGYFLNDFDLAAEILDAVAAPNLALQFDAYHAHRITGDVAGSWVRHGHRAVHVQIAGYPGRHEPATGEIDYPAFFARLDADGYRGFVSAEYAPATTTTEGLGWLAQ
ncbi:MAG: TIM barrel protein [Rhodobacteraceae bacterium]|nr:TIM barrel protein [Paracoccaceae bacterium]